MWNRVVQRLKVLWMQEPLVFVTVVMVSAALPLPFVLPPLIGDRTEPHKPTGARALREYGSIFDRTTNWK
ncbi:hypothetical protein GpartN1_g4510.t1 [Galdieria partita]|uniref:Uncharacterized protein n=1 Tax=Galdieria partita TaxID=83374 RepID=A0A9C7PTE4_9RHOD|nr:hypothetical protein GpartN1_g2199.t1 [Galdieria partita]GJQ12719.1 hypothetical protein GpartN1_g4510.t1 [Galdieria partita]